MRVRKTGKFVGFYQEILLSLSEDYYLPSGLPEYYQKEGHPSRDTGSYAS